MGDGRGLLGATGRTLADTRSRTRSVSRVREDVIFRRGDNLKVEEFGVKVWSRWRAAMTGMKGKQIRATMKRPQMATQLIGCRVRTTTL